MISLFLAGDVMTGRGIDQVLPHPGAPRLYESYAKSAYDYVELAERANGPIARPLAFRDIWGDALIELERRRQDARIVNLATAVTQSAEPEPKGINYKMNPANVGVLNAARIDCCVLANDHVLDWGPAGLVETLTTLEQASVRCAGAGRDQASAAASAIVPVAGRARVLVYALASPTSGVHAAWAATAHKPGVNLLPSFSEARAQVIADEMVRCADGTLSGLDMVVPLLIRNMRLHRASPADASSLADTMNRDDRRFRTRVAIRPDQV